jgi:hypothetical protein
MKDRGVFEAAQSILADPRFRDMPNIKFYLEKACQTQNPEYLIKAYTVNGDFFKKSMKLSLRVKIYMLAQPIEECC